jgi:hypothetical protein
VFSENGHYERQVLLDHPVDECLMGVMLMAVVRNCEFYRSALRDFGHLAGLVAGNNMTPEKKFAYDFLF